MGTSRGWGLHLPPPTPSPGCRKPPWRRQPPLPQPLPPALVRPPSPFPLMLLPTSPPLEDQRAYTRKMSPSRSRMTPMGNARPPRTWQQLGGFSRRPPLWSPLPRLRQRRWHPLLQRQKGPRAPTRQSVAVRGESSARHRWRSRARRHVTLLPTSARSHVVRPPSNACLHVAQPTSSARLHTALWTCSASLHVALCTAGRHFTLPTCSARPCVARPPSSCTHRAWPLLSTTTASTSSRADAAGAAVRFAKPPAQDLSLQSW